MTVLQCYKFTMVLSYKKMSTIGRIYVWIISNGDLKSVHLNNKDALTYCTWHIINSNQTYSSTMGTPWVMLSTEGAKVADWRYNKSITDLKEGKPRQTTTHLPPKWNLTVRPIIYIVKPIDSGNHKWSRALIHNQPTRERERD